MKKIYTLLLSITALAAVQTVKAQSSPLYLSNSISGYVYNPGLGAATNTPIILFDDVSVPDEYISDADSLGLTLVKLGIYRLANAPAVTAKIYLTTVNPDATSYDEIPVVPPVLLGTVNLPANGAANKIDTLSLRVGDSVNVFKSLVKNLDNYFNGYQTFFIGVSFSVAGTGTRWLFTDGPDLNDDVVWEYDVDTDPTITSAFNFSSSGDPVAGFFVEVYGRAIYQPTPADAKVVSITAPEKVTCFDSPQTVSVKIQNNGTNPIAAGAASVDLDVTDANSFSATLTNPSAIPANGGTATLTFTNVPLNTPGHSYIDATVTLADDARPDNDNVEIEQYTAETITTFPVEDDVELLTGDLPLFASFETVTGGDLWTFNTLNNYANYLDAGGDPNTVDESVLNLSYANSYLSDSIYAHSGKDYYIFDAFKDPNSDGIVSRLYTPCVSLVGTGIPRLTFWMTHDTSLTSITSPTAADFRDSLYIIHERLLADAIRSATGRSKVRGSGAHSVCRTRTGFRRDEFLDESP